MEEGGREEGKRGGDKDGREREVEEKRHRVGRSIRECVYRDGK